MANSNNLTNAQYFSNFVAWTPNTGTSLPIPKLNITNTNNLPTANATVIKQTEQKISFIQGF